MLTTITIEQYEFTQPNPIAFTGLESYSAASSFTENITTFLRRYRVHLGRKFADSLVATLQIWSHPLGSATILLSQVRERLTLISKNKPKRLKRSTPDYIKTRQIFLYRIVYLQMIRDLCIILYHKTNELHSVYQLLEMTKDALKSHQEYYKYYNKRREQEQLVNILRDTVIPLDVQQHIISKFFITLPEIKLR